MTVSTLGEVAEQEGSRARPIDWPRLGLTTVQLGLIALVVGAFDFENRALYHILLFATVGFVVHSILPLRWRMQCFALLSVGSVLIALPGTGLWLLGLGALLILLCHLPIGWGLRVALVLLVGAALAWVRQAGDFVPVPSVVWPILAAMFMFRIALYLHSLKHDGPPKDLWGTVAYFFLLPNAAFPLFPIVDYKSFLRSHYDAPESAIYSRGIKWMLRGIYHLVLYRLIYHYLVIDPAQVQTLSDVVRYGLQAYLLYLRVSGQFHLIVGLMHLFGFRLPETHHLYFLASSFTDFWRRINIYWKDFLMKLVYYPSFFRLRRYGNRTGVMVSTAIVMVVTWALHAYQKFWVLGGNPFSVIDALFWGALMVVVLGSALYELRPKAVRTRTRRGYDLRKALGTVMVFATMAFLWGLWSAESVGEFTRTLGQARNVDLQGVLLLAGLVVAGLVIGGWAWGATPLEALEMKDRPLVPDLRHAIFNGVALAGLLVAARADVQQTVGGKLGSLASKVSSGSLNSRDHDLQVRGYYEQMSNSVRTSGRMWEAEAERPRDWVNLTMTDAYRLTGDFLFEELKPGVTITFKRAPFSTNSHGMHDREYSLTKPPGTFRIAIFGASQVMAGGVPDDLAFENILEDTLNARHGGPGRRFEVLNFGMAAASILYQMEWLKRKGLEFQPDLVLLTSVPPDETLLTRHLWVLWRENVPIPYDGLRDAGARVGLDSTMDKATVARLLMPVLDSIRRSAVDRVDSLVRAHGTRAAMVVMRLATIPKDTVRVIADQAHARGWVVLDLSDPFRGRDERELRLASFDEHYNVEGNHLVARHLYQELINHADQLGLPLRPSAAAPAARAGSATP